MLLLQSYPFRLTSSGRSDGRWAIVSHFTTREETKCPGTLVAEPVLQYVPTGTLNCSKSDSRAKFSPTTSTMDPPIVAFLGCISTTLGMA